MLIPTIGTMGVFTAGVVSCLTVSSVSIGLLLVAWLVQCKAIDAVIS
jgi:hypothetical protein